MPAPVSRTFDVFGLLLKFRVMPEEVAGKFFLVEAVVPPGLGAPLNEHAGESECFHVLDGQFEFIIGEKVVPAGPGEIVVVPDGARHAFTCTGQARGRLVIINAPGQMHVDFFSGVGRPLPDEVDTPQPPAGPPDMAHVLHVAQAAGMTLLPPREEVA